MQLSVECLFAFVAVSYLLASLQFVAVEIVEGVLVCSSLLLLLLIVDSLLDKSVEFNLFV